MAAVSKLFMKLTGSSSGLIKGEAQVVNFKDQIELDDWKWSLNRKGKTDAPEPSIFGFSKLMDRATTAMLSGMRNGEPMTAVISMEEASREHFRLILTLEGVLITSYDLSTQVNDAAGGVEESWEFDYDTIRFDYRPNAKEGMSTTTLRRPPGAEKKAPESPEQKMVTLGRSLSAGQLDKVWEQIKSDKAKSGFTKPGDKDKK